MIDPMPYVTWLSKNNRRLKGLSIVMVAALTMLSSCIPGETPEPSRSSGTEAHLWLVRTSTPRAEVSEPEGKATLQEGTPVAGNLPTVWADCAQKEGQIKRDQYSSRLLGEHVPVLVYLPPCYSKTQEYPVLFLLHGKPQDENHWLILGIEQALNQKIAAGEIGAVILVMPEQPEPLFSQTDGGAGSYEGEFLSMLMPYIEDQYAVSIRPDDRAIAGISRGGVWALEIAFANPGRFSGVAALSPALNVNDAREAYDPFFLARNAGDLPGRIFLASGDVDSAAADTERLHEILEQRGIAHRYSTVPGGHEGGTWVQFVSEMMDYLTQDWQFK